MKNDVKGGEGLLNRHNKVFLGSLAVGVLLILLGFWLDDPKNILPGLCHIVTIQDLLITDYVQCAGVGAALVNAGLVTIISVFLMKLSGDPFHGFSFAEIGLMAGFSLFGKNIVNIWPILLGTWIYSKHLQQPFAKYVSSALLATSLSPLVSYMALGSIHANLFLGIVTGLLIGFIIPSLANHTYKMQNGFNLYNTGFACGLFAMVVVPILTALGDRPDTALHWATDYNGPFTIVIVILCAISIVMGSFAAGNSTSEVWTSYLQLLSTSGRAPSDYLMQFGAGPVLVNMGINGLIGLAYIYLMDGHLNGPTLGGIFAIMGFSAYGKHAFNIIPIMLGVALGAFCIHVAPNDPSLQLAGLFGTTLAPISGYFGWPFGILAGFIHASVVLQAGNPVAGLNLYNNGFSGGLIAIVLYPTITTIIHHRRSRLQNHTYQDNLGIAVPIKDLSERSIKEELSWESNQGADYDCACLNVPVEEGIIGTAE